ncbi:Amidohydro-rel domain-containing protein [Mycena venus]|uniref:Amidohydro-rel domain-containing protein n=1 Tax=Mycena venus TaxID=2733690 RepID=A0A8H6XYL0_9AGAR|nr:Amidohydro-rel domain-containing protein [Mycena venus]
MFAKFSALFVAVALATGVTSAPAYKSNGIAARGQSFNNWGGISSLDNFDNFYGSDDFAHTRNFNQVVVKQDSELVCHSEQVVIIQQRLAVLQEMAKKIITEQICEVETQTIVFQQYYASLGGFSHDLTRSSNRHVGYDNSIVQHYGDFYNSDGSLSNYDFGFSGHDIGSNYYVPTNNWNQDSSPSSVGSAYQAAQAASWY